MMGNNMDEMFTSLRLPQAFRVLLPCIILFDFFKKLTCSWLVVRPGSGFSHE